MSTKQASSKIAALGPYAAGVGTVLSFVVLTALVIDDQYRASVMRDALNWTAISVLLTFLIGSAQVGVMFVQSQIAIKQAEITSDQMKITEQQRAIAQDSNQTAVDSLRTNREIERGYLTLVVSQGRFGPHRDGYDRLRFDVELHNVGRTPVDFVGGVIGYRIGELPAVPDMHRGQRLFTKAYIVPNDKIDFGISTIKDDLDRINEIRGKTDDRTKRLWVVGEFDYLDRFGAFHRFGFARLFAATTYTLQFAYETAAWNFDRPLDDDLVRSYKEGIQQESKEKTRTQFSGSSD